MINQLSIIIPAYNEEKIINNTIFKCLIFCNKYIQNYEIIIVNDCSKDSTKNNIMSFLNGRYKNIKHKIKYFENTENMGKGYSVKIGMLNAKYRNVLFTDADASTPIHDIMKLLKYYKTHDVIIGSREMKDSDVRIKQNIFRKFIGRIFSFLTQIILGIRQKDTQCGFKFFKKKVLDKILKEQTINRFAFDIELLYLAKKYYFPIKEVGVQWMNGEKSTVNPIKDSIQMFLHLIHIRKVHG